SENATTPCVRYGELYTKFGTKINQVYSYTNMPPEKLRFSKGTEVLIPRVGEEPMDYNHCTWLSLSNVAIGEMISVYNTNQNPQFTAIMFNATLQKQFAMRVEGGSVTNLYFEKLKDIDISFPSIKEQCKITTYFSSLDHLITLHEKKYNRLVNIKKSMLEKMFPRNGEIVPEVRFAEFTGNWEKRKLGEIADKAVDNRGKTPPITENGTHPLIEVACLGNGSPDYSKVEKYLDDNTFNTMLRDYIKEGDILFSTVGSIGLISLMDSNENAAIAQNVIAFRAKENYDSSFLYAMFSTEENQDKVMRIVMGAVQPSIKVSQLVNVEYSVTDNIDEQKALGKYFLVFDHLIALQQQKLKKLQNMKKACLEKMFV
ncbi:MAG: hypothetical protein HFE57_12950, partial [Firmicutes bacterium]|nr:hypothetical protein [Bacillota bacterium]